MKIHSVTANNRRKAFEIDTKEGLLLFPYAQLRYEPTRTNRVSGA